MSKFFLLSSNMNTSPYPVYPLGMAMVASALLADGHQVRQFDFLVAGGLEKRLRSALTEFEPDFVGISLRNIDNVDSFSMEDEWYLAEARILVELIRQITPVPVIVGGPAFSIMPEEIMDYLAADYGVTGEGERALCDLINKLEKGQSAPRIVSGNGTIHDSSVMATPCWQKDIVDFYIAHSGMLNIQTKRGCPHHCIYCSYPKLEGVRLRAKNPAEVIDQIQRAKQMFGVNTFFITDSVFNDSTGHYLEFVEELLIQNLDINWYGYFRPQKINAKELTLLKRSGLAAMEVGTDASSDTTLTGLMKRFTFADVVEFNVACIQKEIPIAHFIIFAGPNETMDTVAEGLKNIQKLEKCIVFAYAGIRIHADTELHALALREGRIYEKTSLLKPTYYFSPNIDIGIMSEAIQAAFRGRRDRIFPPSEGLARMEVMNRFGYRGLLWDKMISFNK